MDESGVNRAMTRLYARSRVNTRAFGFAPRNWGDNVSILAALSLRGPLQPMCINGATDGRVFLTYLKDVLVPQLWPGAVVVMDNLGAHKVKGVRELIEAAGARLLYLPPYSADFNPIELLWSKLKGHLRKVAARTTEALDRAIAQGLASISAKDARGYFAHRGYLGKLA
jgi:transposase